MSTHQIERRRIKPIGRRRLDVRRMASLVGVLIGVFAIAFGVGHIRATGNTIVERTPPRLPVVATPVAGSLPSAPAIKLAVATPPPPKPSKPAQSSITPVAPVTTTPAAEAPAPAATPAPTPAPAPAPVSPPSRPSTPAAPKSSGGGGSGSGTSFESSG